MHNVVLLCAAGTSTYIFAEKVQEAADKAGYQAHISAWSVSQAKENHCHADLLLLSPQVAFEAELVRSLYPDTKVDVIDFDAFAHLDAESIVDQIKKILGE